LKSDHAQIPGFATSVFWVM